MCIKNIRIIGVGNHPYTEYPNVLKMFEKYGDVYKFEELISHIYPLEKADEALIKSMDDESLKVLIDPNM